jgi:hypothetical protein
MTNFCEPKIEFEDAHDKINETILKQFTNTSNDLPKKKVLKKLKTKRLGMCTSWEKELEAWILKQNIF